VICTIWDSGVSPCVLPASGTLHLPAQANEGNSLLDPTSMTSNLMLLTIIRPNEHYTCIDNPLPYNVPYNVLLPYSDDTPMDDLMSS
jgi:hypothetical protein